MSQVQRQIRIGNRIRMGAQITLLKGGPGSGKTHLLSEFERSFFIPVESGTTGFSTSYACHFFELEGDDGVACVPKTLDALLELIKRFREANVPSNGETQRPYAHLMIDSVSAVEDLIHQEVCRQNGARSMEDSEYGPKLYHATLPLWRRFLAEISAVTTQCGANVWLTGHTEEESAANQAGETYRRVTLRVKGSGKAQSDVRGTITQAMDNDWYLTQQIVVRKGGRGQRTVAQAGGRIILTQPGDTPGGGSYDAKSRIRVPERIPATQEDIRSAMRAGITRPSKRVRAEIDLIVKQLPKEQMEIIAEDLKKSDTAGWLDRTLARAKALLVTTEADKAEDEPETPEEKPGPRAPAEEPAANKSEERTHVEPKPVSEPKPTALPVAPAGISVAMQELLGKLRDARTLKDIGGIAVEASKDVRYTIEEREVCNKHIQTRRQELK